MTTQTKDIAAKSREIWEQLTPSERAGARHGMFPFGVIQAAEREGYDGNKLCVALMECAE